jgi:hypothetical protein
MFVREDPADRARIDGSGHCLDMGHCSSLQSRVRPFSSHESSTCVELSYPRPQHGHEDARRLAATSLAAHTSLMTTMADALVRYERHLRFERGRSPNTIRAYLGDLRSFFGDAQDDTPVETVLGSVSIADLCGWLSEMTAEGASRATIARRASGMKTFFEWAIRRRVSASTIRLPG